MPVTRPRRTTLFLRVFLLGVIVVAVAGAEQYLLLGGSPAEAARLAVDSLSGDAATSGAATATIRGRETFRAAVLLGGAAVVVGSAIILLMPPVLRSACPSGHVAPDAPPVAKPRRGWPKHAFSGRA